MDTITVEHETQPKSEREKISSLPQKESIKRRTNWEFRNAPVRALHPRDRSCPPRVRHHSRQSRPAWPQLAAQGGLLRAAAFPSESPGSLFTIKIEESNVLKKNFLNRVKFPRQMNCHQLDQILVWEELVFCVGLLAGLLYDLSKVICEFLWALKMGENRFVI